MVRAIRRSPGFAIVAVLSLAIGIGASTSVFTVFYAMFLRSLPVRDPQQLRFLNWTGGENVPAFNISGYGSSVNGIRTSGSFSWDAFQAIKKSNTGCFQNELCSFAANLTLGMPLPCGGMA